MDNPDFIKIRAFLLVYINVSEMYIDIYRPWQSDCS